MPASDELIQTKLSPPVSGRRVIPRRRLAAALAAGGLPKLTLVTAPAGFGKTTLMSQWYHALAEGDPKPCWISLDGGDGDVRQLLSYIVGALRSVDSGIGADALELLESQASIKTHRVIGRLVNDLVVEDRSVALFLDDYHSIDGATVGEVVTTLLDLAPAKFHLVIGSRSAPGLPVARLRARGDLKEFTAADLRFDAGEADAFLRAVRGLALKRDQVAVLQERVEGWAAGLQLATLSYGGDEAWESFVRSFRGSMREVADFLAADVLNRQRPELRAFLLDTAVLDRMTAPLCEAVTGRPDAQPLLEEVEDRNLFIVPLDRERRWYRYHHLFADFLRDRLKREQPGRAAELNGRASRWFAEQNSPVEAVAHALKAEEYDQVAQLVEEHALHMLGRGDMPRVDEWIRRLPDGLVERRPRLQLYQCWALFHMRQPERAAASLQRAERAIAELRAAAGSGVDGMTAEAVGQEITALRAGVAISMDDIDAAKFHAAQPTVLNPGAMTWSAAAMANIHGYACLARSEFAEARIAIARARAAHADFGSTFGIVYADCFLGMVEMAEGRLNAAAALFQQAADVSRRGACQAAGTAVANVLRGAVLYEWNRLGDAEALIAPSIALLDECGHVQAQVLGYCVLGKIKHAQARHPEASSFFNSILAICDHDRLRRQRVAVVHESARLLLRDGDIEAARVLARGDGVDFAAAPECDGMSWDRIACLHDLIRARIALAENRPDRVIELVEPGLAVARAVGRRPRAIELLLLVAEAEVLRGGRTAAMAALAETLSLAEPERFIRTFVDHGRSLLPLLRSVQPRSRYLESVIAAFECAAAVGKGEALPLESLSGRESEVLALMASGKGNRAIASELAIAENTVKWHVKNIFQKLGVENRTAAVLAAQKMALIR
ncbi:MAG TPA: LuxR C-terminal-related transcriptional regulator [Woeseiaceae bacterium]|nr:LuxR C-terminal-related transcriptional regulator [Woeseiaceae bacterium]